MLTADEKRAIDRIANGIQSALLLASRVRRLASEHSEESLQLEAAIDRVARELTRLRPEGR